MKKLSVVSFVLCMCVAFSWANSQADVLPLPKQIGPAVPNSIYIQDRVDLKTQIEKDFSSALSHSGNVSGTYFNNAIIQVNLNYSAVLNNYSIGPKQVYVVLKKSGKSKKILLSENPLGVYTGEVLASDLEAGWLSYSFAFSDTFTDLGIIQSQYPKTKNYTIAYKNYATLKAEKIASLRNSFVHTPALTATEGQSLDLAVTMLDQNLELVSIKTESAGITSGSKWGIFSFIQNDYKTTLPANLIKKSAYIYKIAVTVKDPQFGDLKIMLPSDPKGYKVNVKTKAQVQAELNAVLASIRKEKEANLRASLLKTDPPKIIRTQIKPYLYLHQLQSFPGAKAQIYFRTTASGSYQKVEGTWDIQTSWMFRLPDASTKSQYIYYYFKVYAMDEKIGEYSITFKDAKEKDFRLETANVPYFNPEVHEDGTYTEADGTSVETVMSAQEEAAAEKKYQDTINSVKPSFKHIAASQRYFNKDYEIRLEQAVQPAGIFSVTINVAYSEDAPTLNKTATYDQQQKAWIFNFSKEYAKQEKIVYSFNITYQHPDNSIVWFSIFENDSSASNRSNWFKTSFVEEAKPVIVIPQKTDEEVLKETLSHQYLTVQPANQAIQIQLDQKPLDITGTATLFWSYGKNGPFNSIEGSPNSFGYGFILPESATKGETIYYYFTLKVSKNNKAISVALGEKTEKFVVYFEKAKPTESQLSQLAKDKIKILTDSVSHPVQATAFAGKKMTLSLKQMPFMPEAKIALYYSYSLNGNYQKLESTTINYPLSLWNYELPANAVLAGTIYYYFIASILDPELGNYSVIFKQQNGSNFSLAIGSDAANPETIRKEKTNLLSNSFTLPYTNTASYGQPLTLKLIQHNPLNGTSVDLLYKIGSIGAYTTIKGSGVGPEWTFVIPADITKNPRFQYTFAVSYRDDAGYYSTRLSNPANNSDFFVTVKDTIANSNIDPETSAYQEELKAKFAFSPIIGLNGNMRLILWMYQRHANKNIKVQVEYWIDTGTAKKVDAIEDMGDSHTIVIPANELKGKILNYRILLEGSFQALDGTLKIAKQTIAPLGKEYFSAPIYSGWDKSADVDYYTGKGSNEKGFKTTAGKEKFNELLFEIKNEIGQYDIAVYYRDLNVPEATPFTKIMMQRNNKVWSAIIAKANTSTPIAGIQYYYVLYDKDGKEIAIITTDRNRPFARF